MELQIFQNSGFQIRGGLIDNEPFFVAKDVCDMIGLTNPSVAIQSVDEDERAKLDLGRQGEAWTPPHTTPLKMRTTLSLLKIE